MFFCFEKQKAYLTTTTKMKRIAVFASGSGTNAENLINYFRQNDGADISLILTDNPKARVLERAAKYSVPTVTFSREELREGKVLDKLVKNKIDFIVLAGFLSLVPRGITEHYQGRIVNIHPALLPAYGGKGMYGMKVHQAVIDAGEEESGITIHYVNENYDDGDIVFQARTEVFGDDTPEDLAERVHALEYKYYPQVVDDLVSAL